MKNFFKHLHLVNKHRFMVFKHCLKCGILWRGIVHDLSKYSITEFWESVKYYTGTYSPIENCRRQNGHSRAWIHHKNKNKHHIEYWYDRENKVQINMPYKYAVESICDKISATKCYRKKEYNPQMVLDHWLNIGSKPEMNENTKQFFTIVFTDLVKYGEKHVLRKKYLKQKYIEVVVDSTIHSSQHISIS